MNCRAIVPLFQGLAANENRLAAKNAFKNAIADHQGGFPTETPGYFGKVGADVTTPARKGKRRNQALLPRPTARPIAPPYCPLPAIQPLPVSIRSQCREKTAVAAATTPNRHEIARDFNKFLP
jgi:hypothetical protein